MKLAKSYVSKIPNEYRREYLNVACRNNLSRMLVASILLFLVEPFVAIFFETPKSSSFFLALWIALFSLFFIPILYFFMKNVENVTTPCLMIVQMIFLSAVLMGGISWSLYEQSRLASCSSYFLTVFGISAFITMPPIISAAVLVTANFVFMMLLPQFQTLPDIIATLNINTILMTAVAWILNQMVTRNGVDYFIHEKIIIEKNAELEKKNKELNELTMRDSMTNLLNHKNSLRRLKEEVDRAKRIDYPLSVAMIDLDNFKEVNDTYGHQTGDEVLIRVAEILKENCRVTDTVGRYGGEEFIIIMPDTSEREAALLAQRIRTIIDETAFKEGIHITLSCGISELNGESVHGILKSSDIMLYEAKKKGKNRIEVSKTENKKSENMKTEDAKSENMKIEDIISGDIKSAEIN